MSDFTPQATATLTAPEATPPAPQTTPQTANPKWYDAIQDDDLKAYTANKAWDDPVEAVKSYRNLEQFMGADKAGRGVVLPKEGASDEEVKAFYQKIGLPESPDKYDLAIPEGGDDAFAKEISPILHKANLTNAQAKALSTHWNAYMADKAKEAQAKQEGEFYTQKQNLEKEWGGAFDHNLSVARQAIRAFGIDGDKIDALEKSMGFAETIKFFNNIGQKIGEDKFIDGNGNTDFTNGAMTPAMANQKYQELIKDPEFVKKYQAGDAKARATMDNINKYR